MLITDFLNQLKADPDSIEFEDSMAVIEANYGFTGSAFRNGDVVNQVDENMGSCKVFAFGKIHQLSEAQTLACFGKYYREDVLLNPDSDNHQNIRSFIRSAWSGIEFLGDIAVLEPLAKG